MTAPANQSWAAVYDGTRCIGHVLWRGPKGFEAFDADDRSLGRFASMSDAAKVLEALGNVGR